MTEVIAALLAAVASVALGLRAQMLKPELSAFPDSPRCVRWASFGLSVVLGAYVLGVVEGHDATLTELALLAALAAYAVLLWLNLYRQGLAAPDPDAHALAAYAVHAARLAPRWPARSLRWEELPPSERDHWRRLAAVARGEAASGSDPAA